MNTKYKRTKIGTIPIEWDVFRLSEISTELTEKAGDREFETLSISAGIGFVNQANKFGKELSGKQYEKYIVLHRGDFSYNKGNSQKYPQGCIYMLRDREAAAVPNVFESFRLTKGVQEFYEQLFISGFLNQQLFAKINHGVRDDGLLNLRGEDFYKCRLPFPPLPEQQKIAEILTAQDAVIALMQKQIELLQKQKKAFLQKMFPQKGSNVPEIRFAGFTDAWEQRKLGDIIDKLTGGASIAPDDYVDEGYRTIPKGAINDTGVADMSGCKCVSEAFYRKNISSKTSTGELLTSLRDLVPTAPNMGRIVRIYGYSEDFLMPQGAYSIKLKTDSDEDFIIAYSNSPDYRKTITTQKNGSTQVHIRNGEFLNIDILVPSYEEQKKIGLIIKNLDNLITLHQRKLEIEQQKKKALMQLLLTGKVRVKT